MSVKADFLSSGQNAIYSILCPALGGTLHLQMGAS